MSILGIFRVFALPNPNSLGYSACSDSVLTLLDLVLFIGKIYFLVNCKFTLRVHVYTGMHVQLACTNMLCVPFEKCASLNTCEADCKI